MPKKTLALIVGLVIVTFILFIIAVNNTNQSKQPPPQEEVTASPSPTSEAQTVITLSPETVSLTPGRQGSVDVVMNPGENAVTAVQLELQYDPKMIGTVVVKPGALFTNPVVLINTNNVQTGRVTYAFGIQPNQQTVSGEGTVATITFTGKGKVGDQTALTILPESLVSARGMTSSVLKSATGATITFDTARARDLPATVTTAPPVVTTQ